MHVICLSYSYGAHTTHTHTTNTHTTHTHTMDGWMRIQCNSSPIRSLYRHNTNIQYLLEAIHILISDGLIILFIISDQRGAAKRTGRDPDKVIVVPMDPKPHVWTLAWNGVKHVFHQVWEGVSIYERNLKTHTSLCMIKYRIGYFIDGI